MGATFDQPGSMTKALENFEGAPCVDHKIQKRYEARQQRDIHNTT